MREGEGWARERERIRNWTNRKHAKIILMSRHARKGMQAGNALSPVDVDICTTSRGKRIIFIIGQTYVAERRTARMILLIRREVDQIGQRSCIAYGNLLPRWLRAWVYTARQRRLSVINRFKVAIARNSLQLL